MRWGRMADVSQNQILEEILVNRSFLLIAVASLAGTLQAQSPLIAENKPAYTGVKNNLINAAEKMPEDAYSFKATPDVQSFGERVVHVAGQTGTCSSLTGKRKPNPAANKTSKADLVAALRESFDACDAAWDSMNEKSSMEMVAGRGGQQRLDRAGPGH